MTDHLPECWASDQIDTTEPLCICDRRRVCEQRVFTLDEYEDVKRRAYLAGLSAARDAVARSCGHTKHAQSLPCAHDDALAAIDALRGEA